jgi:hypothetical protein
VVLGSIIPLILSLRLARCKLPIGYPDPCRKIYEGAVHGYGVYSAWMGPNDLVLLRFPIIEKEKEKERLDTCLQLLV